MTDSRYADVLDQASALSQTLVDNSVDVVRQRNKPEQVQNKDGTWPITDCIDCEDHIPTARLNLGKVRCVECQTHLERATNGTR